MLRNPTSKLASSEFNDQQSPTIASCSACARASTTRWKTRHVAVLAGVGIMIAYLALGAPIYLTDASASQDLALVAFQTSHYSRIECCSRYTGISVHLAVDTLITMDRNTRASQRQLQRRHELAIQAHYKGIAHEPNDEHISFDAPALALDFVDSG